MRFDMTLPWWAYALMGLGLVLFVIMVAIQVRRYHGVPRSLFASPYALWIVMFTVLPIVVIAYYAFTDKSGAFTLDNFRLFWDSNYLTKKNLLETAGPDAVKILGMDVRGTLNVDILVKSLWMAFLCTVISLLVGYPAALFMVDREVKLGPALVVLFVIPMWMNFLLRTLSMVSLLKDTGLINHVIQWLGFPQQKMLGTEGAVLLGMVYNFLPFMIFPIHTSLHKQDYHLQEAAQDLGCNPWQTLYKVVMPLSLPGVISGITMVFMPSVTSIFLTTMLGEGNFMLFGDLIEDTFLNQHQWNAGSALSLIMMMLILISLSILRKADPEGEGGGI